MHIFRGTMRERDSSENTSVGGIMILKFTFKNCDRVLEWTDLSQVRNKWLAEYPSIYHVS